MPPPNKQMKNNNQPSPAPSVAQTNPAQVQVQLEIARKAVETAYIAYHNMLQSKVLNSNKSPQDKQQEQAISAGLFKSGQDLDQVNAGEGTVILTASALQELVVMRNRLNEIEYTALLTRKELNDLKTSLGEKP
jgi:hypothetical protein